MDPFGTLPFHRTVTIPIQHHPEQGRFVALVDGHRGVIEYRQADGVMTITHTEVAPALEGRGVAAALMKAALAHAAADDLKVDPQCSYASGYMRRHPESMARHV